MKNDDLASEAVKEMSYKSKKVHKVFLYKHMLACASKSLFGIKES